MSDRYDRAVAGLLAAAVLTCAGAAAFLRPTPLSGAVAARWAAMPRLVSGVHAFRRTWQIDAIDVGSEHAGYAERFRPLRAGEALTITGWAIDPQTERTASAVTYRIDGGPWREARYHLPRPDVGAVLNVTGADDAGFTATVETGALRPGEHAIEFATGGAHDRRTMRPTVRFAVTR